MQISNAFGLVRESLSWFINVYSAPTPLRRVGKLRSIVLTGFHSACIAAQQEQRGTPRIQNDVASTAGEPAVAQRARSICRRRQPLVTDANIDIAPGRRVLIQGPSGSRQEHVVSRHCRHLAVRHAGASAAAGNLTTPCSCRSGHISRSVRCARRCAIRAAPERFTDEQIKEALTSVGPCALAARGWRNRRIGRCNYRAASSSASLSRAHCCCAGLAVPRRGHLQPRRSQSDALYELLNARLKQSTIISIAHRADLAQYHDRSVRLQFIPGSANCLHELASQPV